MGLQVAAQLYTVRKYTQTVSGIAQAIGRVRAMGYRAVQCSGMGPIAAGELRKILADEGVICCSTHEPFERLRDEGAAVLEKHTELGCKYTAIGSMPEAYRNREGYARFAGELTEIAGRLGEGGLAVGYHNHDFEFEKFGGKTGMEILIEGCGPAVHFEMDTYWVQAGGGDPAQWIRRVKGRAPLVHLKDMVWGVDEGWANSLTRNEGESEESFVARRAAARQPRGIMSEVGEGNLNWRGILEACAEAGVEWHIVEQDYCRGGEFEALGVSFRNLLRMGGR